MRNKTAGAMCRTSSGYIQAIGDTSGKVWQMHSGDARDGAGYRGFITTPSYVQGDRSRMKRYGRVFVDAETNGTYPLTTRVILGRSDLPTPGGSVLSPSGFGATDGWGTGTFGEAVWGGSVVPGKWIRPDKVLRGVYARLVFETSGPNQWFRLNGTIQEFSMRRHILAA